MKREDGAREGKGNEAKNGQGRGRRGRPQNKTIFKSDHATVSHLQRVCYSRKNSDRRILFKDDQVTVSFPGDNKPELVFLSVTISDLSLFLGLKLASEPFT